MIERVRQLLKVICYLAFALNLAVNSGCASGSYAAKGAAEGATTGAVAGAAGGMLTALIFGGDIVEAGARGAVYGGTTGAVVGGMAGSKADDAEAERARAEREAELDQLRKEIGSDAFNGVVALAECKHAVAIANAREARESKNKDYSLAGLWVEVLTEADRKQDAQAQSLLPEIVERDRDVKSEADAEDRMREALQELRNIRGEYDLPTVCPT